MPKKNQLRGSGRGKRPPSEHRMAPGWAQQSVQIPEQFREQFRKEAADRGHSSIKTLGTIAMGILLGMPEDVRTGMFIWTQSKIARSEGEIEPSEIYATFGTLLDASGDSQTEENMVRLLVRALRGDADIPPTEHPATKNR